MHLGMQKFTSSYFMFFPLKVHTIFFFFLSGRFKDWIIIIESHGWFIWLSPKSKFRGCKCILGDFIVSGFNLCLFYIFLERSHFRCNHYGTKPLSTQQLPSISIQIVILFWYRYFFFLKFLELFKSMRYSLCVHMSLYKYPKQPLS